MTDRKLLSPKRLPLVLLLAAGCLGAPLPVAFAAQPAAAVTQGAETWTINMKDADIRDFIDQVAEISGETFVVDPRVKGQVTVISKHPLGLEEVYQLFLSVMSTHGFSVLDELGQSLGVSTVFHGHHHDRLDYRSHRQRLGFATFGVGLRGITDMHGRVLRAGELD